MGYNHLRTQHADDEARDDRRLEAALESDEDLAALAEASAPPGAGKRGEVPAQHLLFLLEDQTSSYAGCN